MKILIVEDDQSVTDLYLASLSEFQCETATCGASAVVTYLEKGPFDGILLDLKMPEYDGIFVINWFRKQSSQIPIIVVSGHPGMAEQAKQQGTNMCLEKPVDIEGLKNGFLAFKHHEETTIFSKYHIQLSSTGQWCKGFLIGPALKSK